MFKSLWATAIVTLVGASLLLTPATSEAQRRGGGGRGNRGRGGERGGGERHEGGGYRGWDGGWGGGYGYGLGYGLGYGNRGYYGWGSPGYSNSYNYGTPIYDSQSYTTLQYSFYPDTQSNYASGTQMQGGMQMQLANPNDAGFVVRVADPNAEIWFQNYKTQQRGMVRHFESEALDPNSTYTFQVRAKWMQNGQQMDQTRNVQARAGQNMTVDFTNTASEQIPTNPQRRPLSNNLDNQQFNTPNQQTPRTPNTQNPNTRPNNPPNQQNEQGSLVNPQRP